MEVVINMNDRVRVKLSERGALVMEEQRIVIDYYPEERVYKGQLWELMQIFGEHIYMGGEPPFMSITVIDDTFANKMDVEDDRFRRMYDKTKKS